MSLLNNLMDNARKAEIGFGVHADCVITKVSNEKRKNKDGQVVKRNSYTMIGKLNSEGKVVAEREISFFNLDSASEYVYGNWFTQLEQLTAIVDTLVPVGKKDKWANALDAIAEEFEFEAETKEELEAELTEVLTDKKLCVEYTTAVWNAYVEILTPIVGVESQPIRFKCVYDKSGKYLQQPRFDGFVESMEVDADDSRLRITDTELQYKSKSLVVGGGTGKKPTGL
jgi:hypothetical protein